MSEIEDHDAHLPRTAQWAIWELGGALPVAIESTVGASMTGQLNRLGWKILPIPNFRSPQKLVLQGSAAFIDFGHPREWLIVPPDTSDIKARKIDGRIRAIRVAHRLAVYGEPAGDTLAGHQWHRPAVWTTPSQGRREVSSSSKSRNSRDNGPRGGGRFRQSHAKACVGSLWSIWPHGGV